MLRDGENAGNARNRCMCHFAFSSAAERMENYCQPSISSAFERVVDSLRC
jgi:hypothetical protein